MTNRKIEKAFSKIYFKVMPYNRELGIFRSVVNVEDVKIAFAFNFSEIQRIFFNHDFNRKGIRFYSENE